MDIDATIFETWYQENQVNFEAYLRTTETTPETIEPRELVVMALRYDPVLFVRAVLGVNPCKWQIEFLRAVRDHSRVTARAGKGVGKTIADAWLVLWFVSTHFPCKVACISASEDQLKTGLWAEIGSCYGQMPKWWQDQLTYQATTLYLKSAPSDAFANVRTANPNRPQTLAGLHKENTLIIVDEASDVEDSSYIAIEGIFATGNPKLVVTGNPTKLSGYFYDIHRNPSKSSIWKCFHIPFSNEFAEHIRPEFAEEKLKQYGGDVSDPDYRISILGEFPDTTDLAVIPRPLMEPALSGLAEETGGLVVWGVDVARSANRDRSALAKRQGNTLLEPVQTWREVDITQSAARILAQYNALPPQHRPAEIIVDGGGGYGSLADILRGMGLPAFEVNVSTVPNNPAKYAKRRDELWFKCREWFDLKNRKFKYSDEPEKAAAQRKQYEYLINELAIPGFKFVSGDKKKVESKDDIRKRAKLSPDMADAFNLTFAGHADKYDIDLELDEYEEQLNSDWVL